MKDAISSFFDILIVRTEHHTNEIVKVLTLVSILLLASALLAGVAGMNVNFKPEVFVDSSSLFCLITVTVIAIAGTSLVLARLRHWI